jgi:hypothetical protein
MGSWVAAIKFGLRLYGDRITSQDLTFNFLIINGQSKKITNGRTNISRKGYVIKAGNKLTFSTGDGEEVDFITFGSFMNVYVRSNIQTVHGICSQQFIRSKFFNNVHIGKIVKINHSKCPKRKIYKKICKNRKLKRGALRQCIDDLCAGLDKKIEEKIININKEENRVVIKKIQKKKKGNQNNLFIICRSSCSRI